MNMFAKLKSWYFMIILGIMVLMYLNLNRRIDDFENKLDLILYHGLIGEYEVSTSFDPSYFMIRDDNGNFRC